MFFGDDCHAMSCALQCLSAFLDWSRPVDTHSSTGDGKEPPELSRSPEGRAQGAGLAPMPGELRRSWEAGASGPWLALGTALHVLCRALSERCILFLPARRTSVCTRTPDVIVHWLAVSHTLAHTHYMYVVCACMHVGSWTPSASRSSAAAKPNAPLAPSPHESLGYTDLRVGRGGLSVTLG